MLKQHRRSAGQSQEALAGRAGCSLFTVSRIERGLHEPAWPLALALARALGVGVEAFVVGDVAPVACEEGGPC